MNFRSFPAWNYYCSLGSNCHFKVVLPPSISGKIKESGAVPRFQNFKLGDDAEGRKDGHKKMQIKDEEVVKISSQPGRSYGPEKKVLKTGSKTISLSSSYGRRDSNSSRRLQVQFAPLL